MSDRRKLAEKFHATAWLGEGGEPAGLLYEAADQLADALLAAERELEQLRKETQMRYVIVGHYCPTDATPYTDSETDLSALVVKSRKEAENWLLWYPDGQIVAVRDDGTDPPKPDTATHGYDVPNDPEPGDSE